MFDKNHLENLQDELTAEALLMLALENNECEPATEALLMLAL